MRRTKFYKRYSNKKIRRTLEIYFGKGNHFHKIFDYKWEIY